MSRGYLIPDNVQPEGFRCFFVYIPDDDMYQYAFFGAYEFFGAWLAWERDEAKRGQLAAAAWKQAIEMTRDAMGCESYDYTNAFELIAEAIGRISISQTVNCGGGSDSLVCYGTDGQPTVNLTPYTPDDNVLPPTGDDWPMDTETDEPPVGFDTWEDYDSHACEAANAYYELLVVVLTVLGQVVAIAGDLVEWLLSFAQKMAEKYELEAGWMQRIINALITVDEVMDDDIDVIVSAVYDAIVNHQQAIVCMMYTNRHDIPAFQTEFRSQVTSFISDFMTLQQGDMWVIGNFLDSLAPNSSTLEWLLNPLKFVLTVEPIDCSACISNGTTETVISFVSELPSGVTVDNGSWRVDGYVQLNSGTLIDANLYIQGNLIQHTPPFRIVRIEVEISQYDEADKSLISTIFHDTGTEPSESHAWDDEDITAVYPEWETIVAEYSSTESTQSDSSIAIEMIMPTSPMGEAHQLRIKTITIYTESI